MLFNDELIESIMLFNDELLKTTAGRFVTCNALSHALTRSVAGTDYGSRQANFQARHSWQNVAES